jgi:hypothetical protein
MPDVKPLTMSAEHEQLYRSFVDPANPVLVTDKVGFAMSAVISRCVFAELDALRATRASTEDGSRDESDSESYLRRLCGDAVRIIRVCALITDEHVGDDMKALVNRLAAAASGSEGTG